MSQFFTGTTAGSLPPSVAESYTTDFVDLTIPAAPIAGGTVVPQAHILRVAGGNGIATYQTSNPGDLFISFQQAKGVTVGSQTFQTSFPVPSNTTLTFQVIIAAFADNSDGAGCYGSIICKNVAGTASIISAIDLLLAFDSTLNGINVTASTSGANMQINCLGIAGRTINWTVSFPGICQAPD